MEFCNWLFQLSGDFDNFDLILDHTLFITIANFTYECNVLSKSDDWVFQFYLLEYFIFILLLLFQNRLFLTTESSQLFSYWLRKCSKWKSYFSFVKNLIESCSHPCNKVIWYISLSTSFAILQWKCKSASLVLESESWTLTQ